MWISVRFLIDFHRQSMIIIFCTTTLGCLSNHNFDAVLHGHQETPLLADVLDSPLSFTSKSGNFARCVVVDTSKYDSTFCLLCLNLVFMPLNAHFPYFRTIYPLLVNVMIMKQQQRLSLPYNTSATSSV